MTTQEQKSKNQLLIDKIDYEYGSENDEKIIIKLIEEGADVNFRNGEALVICSKNHRCHMAAILIKNGANVHVQKDKVLKVLGSEIDPYNYNDNAEIDEERDDFMNLILDSDEPESFLGIKDFSEKIQEEIIRRLNVKSYEMLKNEVNKLKDKYPELKNVLKRTSPKSIASYNSNLGLVKLLLLKYVTEEN